MSLRSRTRDVAVETRKLLLRGQSVILANFVILHYFMGIEFRDPPKTPLYAASKIIVRNL